MENIETVLDDYVTILNNHKRNDEQSLKVAIDIVNCFSKMDIFVLGESDWLTHEIFSILAFWYQKQVSLWYCRFVLSNHAENFVSKFGNLLMQLSEHVVGTNVMLIQQIVHMNLTREFLICLKNILTRLDDPNCICMGHLIYSFWGLQYNPFFLEDKPIHDQLIVSITDFLSLPWYQSFFFK